MSQENVEIIRRGYEETAPRRGEPKIVLLGMLARIPVGGVAWLVGQYAAGFERLGYEVHYVETHARPPSMFMSHEEDDGAANAAAYIERVAERFGLGDRWAFHMLHEHGHRYGMTEERLDGLYRDAALIVNMHGGSLPLPEHAVTDRLVFLGTDPVELELEVNRRDKRALDFLDRHVAFFTWGLNFGNPDCGLPWARPYPFVPTPPAVVLDFWDNDVGPDAAPFTTIGNWRQPYRNVRHGGRVYRWSKHEQFLKVLNLPLRTGAPIELALSSYEERDHLVLAEHGWRVRSGLELSNDLDSYREYIVGSAGEVSVAKEQNVHFRSGWFGERSVTYLAAGRPVIVQDTGFGAALPTGEGLFAFSDLDEAVQAVDAVRSNPARHRRAAREIAREYLGHEVVLGHMLEHVGLRPTKRWRSPRNSPATAQLPPRLSLEVTSRRPLELEDETRAYVLARPIPAVAAPPASPVASVVVPVLDSLACTRLALESVLANTEEPPYEVVVVDNGSGEETRTYLEVLAARNLHVRVIRNDENRGFAGACNQGLAAAVGEILVLLNNDTVVPPGWLSGLVAHLGEAEVGVVGPTTNWCGGGAQIPTGYATYEEMLDFARVRRDRHAGEPAVDIDIAEMFCAAIRREVFEAVGPLDERFEIGMFEDDDYMQRLRDAGYRVVCANDLFVHHFGEASLGELAGDGRYGKLFHANRRRFEEKWGVAWEPHARRNDPAYAALAGRVRRGATRRRGRPDRPRRGHHSSSTRGRGRRREAPSRGGGTGFLRGRSAAVRSSMRWLGVIGLGLGIIALAAVVLSRGGEEPRQPVAAAGQQSSGQRIEQRTGNARPERVGERRAVRLRERREERLREERSRERRERRKNRERREGEGQVAARATPEPAPAARPPEPEPVAPQPEPVPTPASEPVAAPAPETTTTPVTTVPASSEPTPAAESQPTMESTGSGGGSESDGETSCGPYDIGC